MNTLRQADRPVLVIDDEQFALKLTARQMRNQGFDEVLAHADSLEALTAARALVGRDALLILDLQMPDLDGIEFIRLLAGMPFDGELVLLSGEHRRIVQAAVRLARAHGLRVLAALPKPVDPVAMAQLLQLPPAVSSRQSSLPGSPDWLTVELLQGALQRGELLNHYQPKVSLGTGEIVGVETLARWQHPQRGWIPPDVFIPFAEQHGLIQPLTRHVLGEAFRQMRSWDDSGLRLQVAANISMDDLDALDFPDVVSELASRHGGTLSRLTLEVTESRLMRDALHAIDALGRLRLKRVSLSIDDYGTGHSSLSQLRDLPFDELKLDRSFVQGAHSLPDLRCILESTVRMARMLDLGTVAEGVETLEEWQLLRDIGCEAAQGWFISRPMAGPALSAWLGQWPSRKASLLAVDEP